MSEKKQVTTTTTDNLFGKQNYTWILIGIVVIAIGLILMAGGNSNDPNVFNKDSIYSTTRITVAPIVILLGLGIEVFAIFRKPKQ
jgi:uncharacterized SAM-binding protein YcdF (DUF218 family)